MKDLRERLSSYEEAPSEELWSKIAAAQQREKDRIWPLLVEATSLAGMGLLVFSLLNFETTKKEQIKEQMVETPATQQKQVMVLKEERVKDVKDVKEQEHTQALPDTSVPSPLVVFEEKEEVSVTESPSPSPSPTQSQSPSPSSLLTQPEKEEQEEVIPPYKKPKSKFQFYFSVTPSLSFQKLIPSGNDNVIIQGLEHRSPFSIKRFGLGLDAGFQRDINRIFGFYGGLSFYRQQQELTYNYYDKDAQVTRVSDEWVFIIDRQQHSKTFDYAMTNLGISSGLLVTVKGEKLKHKLGAGLAYSYNFRKASYLSYQLFYRNELKINDHLSWYIEPTFIYSFISKEKLNEPFTLKPYRAGIRTGVLFRF